jgi:hypothetical protein
VSLSAREDGRRIAILLGVFLIVSPFRAGAQDLSAVAAGEVPQLQASVALDEPSGGVQTRGRGLLVPLYVSFAALQALDVQSTSAALDRGGREANPVMAGVVGSPVAFVALKAATGAAVIYASERMRRRSRIGALVTMAALNGLYATIVMRNYGVAAR